MDLLLNAAERASRYLEGLDDRPVGPPAADVARLGEFVVPLLAEGIGPEATLAELDEIGSPATTGSAGRRYFGFVTGGSHPAGLAAKVLASAWDQNAALGVMSPVASALDAVALGWIREILQLPEQAEGVFVSGASMANATAIAAARDHVLRSAGWDVREDGLIGAPPLTVVVGGEVHTTVLKLLGFLGIGRSSILTIPADEQGRMSTLDLPEISGPTLVIAQAGNVNSGSFDPFIEIIDWAHAGDAWVHVDGAFGLWASASANYSTLTAGAELADSWATDCHKWLNTPYDSAVAFVREPSALSATFGVDAAYLPTGIERNNAMLGPSFSQRARGVEAWAVLRSRGSDGVAELVERTCSFASRIAEALTNAGHQVLNEVVLNQVVVHFGEHTDEVIEAIQNDGTCWCGGTTWQGKRAMRISVSSWATTESDIDRSIRVILGLATTTLSRYE